MLCALTVHDVQLSLELEQEILQQGRQAIEEVLGFMAHKDLSMRLNEVDKCMLRLHTLLNSISLLWIACVWAGPILNNYQKDSTCSQ